MLFCTCLQPCLGRGLLGRPAATRGGGLPGVPGWTLLGPGGARGACWVSITAEPDARRGPPHWAAGPGLLSSQPTDSPAQRAHGEPRQLWRSQGRGSAPGGKDAAAAEAVHCGSGALGEAISHWVSERGLRPPWHRGGRLKKLLPGAGCPFCSSQSWDQDPGPGGPAEGFLQQETPLEGVMGTQTPRGGHVFIYNVALMHT